MPQLRDSFYRCRWVFLFVQGFILSCSCRIVQDQVTAGKSEVTLWLVFQMPGLLRPAYNKKVAKTFCALQDCRTACSAIFDIVVRQPPDDQQYLSIVVHLVTDLGVKLPLFALLLRSQLGYIQDRTSNYKPVCATIAAASTPATTNRRTENEFRISLPGFRYCVAIKKSANPAYLHFLRKRSCTTCITLASPWIGLRRVTRCRPWFYTDFADSPAYQEAPATPVQHAEEKDEDIVSQQNDIRSGTQCCCRNALAPVRNKIWSSATAKYAAGSPYSLWRESSPSPWPCLPGPSGRHTTFSGEDRFNAQERGCTSAFGDG